MEAAAPGLRLALSGVFGNIVGIIAALLRLCEILQMKRILARPETKRAKANQRGP